MEFIEKKLKHAKQKFLHRKMLCFEKKEKNILSINGNKVIDFCSNDYLGLSQHPLLIKRSKEYLDRYGASSTASRLVCGNLQCFEKVEKKLAMLKETEECLIFNSGFQANTTVIPTLTDRRSLLLLDRLCHNSLIQGAKLSQACILRYRHNDYNHLEKLLKENNNKNFSRIMIITESIFGMNGDMLDIEKVCLLANKYNAMLYLDEAHATGIVGKRGMGLSCSQKEVTISMGTFGKSFGGFGAYIATSKKIKEYLINFCPGLIFTTALPPSIIGAIDAAIDLIPQMDKERKELFEKANYLREAFQNMNFNTLYSSTHIIPIIIKNEKTCLSIYNKLLAKNTFAIAIRPPTVPQNTSRLRFALSTWHTTDHIKKLIIDIKSFQKEILCQT